MDGIVAGTEYLPPDVAGRAERPPGCSAPGTLVAFAFEFEREFDDDDEDGTIAI